jgi:signal transduction histidine kinase
MVASSQAALLRSRLVGVACALSAAVLLATAAGLLLRVAEDRARRLLMDYVEDRTAQDFEAQPMAAWPATAEAIGLSLARRTTGRAIVHAFVDSAGQAGGHDWSPTPDAEGHQRALALTASDGRAGTVRLRILWSHGFSMIGTDTLLAAVGAAFVLVLMTLALALLVIETWVIRPLGRRLDELGPLIALARGVQMLAHDVRKPFTMMKMMLQTLHSATDPSQMRGVARRFLPEVDLAIQRVEAMTFDIMEFGGTKSLELAPISVEALLEATLEESFKVHRTADVRLEYRLQHSRKVSADAAKLLRVLSNIVCNAIQAMKGRGRLWFQTRELMRSGVPMLELCIGNSDTYIPPEDLTQLFTPFFTKGKQGGTGLGLAIADKIVKEHGGSIRASSDRDVGTEFWLTLPLSAELNRATAVLPHSSREIVAALGPLDAHADGGDGPEVTDASAERLPAHSRSVPAGAVGLPELAVLDDDVFMREAWTLGRHDARVHTYSSLEDFCRALTEEPSLGRRLRLVVTDFYFGAESDADGHEVAAFVRRELGIPVLVASELHGTLPKSADVAAYIDKLPQAWASLAQAAGIDRAA